MYEICGILLRDLRLASIGISLCLDASLVITPLYLAETERERESTSQSALQTGARGGHILSHVMS